MSGRGLILRGPLFFLAGAASFLAYEYFPLTVCAALAAASAFLLSRSRLAWPALLVAGFVYAFVRAEPAMHAARAGSTDRAVIEGFFLAGARDSGGALWQDFHVTGGGTSGSIAVRGHREFPAGDAFVLLVDIVHPREHLNPGGARSKPYASLVSVLDERGGSRHPLAMIEGARAGLDAHLRQRLSPDAAALVSALTTGERANMSGKTRRDFSRAGLAHLLSISGTHFGFFAVVLFGVFRLLMGRLPMRHLERLTLYMSTWQAAALCTFPFMVYYLGLSGARVPTQRAFVMMGLFLLGLLISRGAHWLNFLVAAALVVALLTPSALIGASFLMSFGAVLFIGFLVRESGMFHRGVRGVPVGLSVEKDQSPALRVRNALMFAPLASMAAALGVYPISAHYFHELSVVSPLANAVVTPLVGFLLVPLSLLGSFMYLMTGEFLVGPLAEPLARLSIYLGSAFASIPYSSVAVPAFPAALALIYYAGFALAAIRNKAAYAAIGLLAVAAYASVAMARPFEQSIVFLSAGNSDAAYLTLPGSRAMAMDTGRSGFELRNALRHDGVTGLDAIVISHGHADHIGGLAELAETFPAPVLLTADNIELAPELLARTGGRKVLQRGDMVTVGKGGQACEMLVLHPYDGFYSEAANENAEANDMSLVLRLRCPWVSVLFAGDAETGAIEDIAHIPPGFLGTDVLKAPHHALRPGDVLGLAELSGARTVLVSAKGLGARARETLGARRLLVTGERGAVRLAPGPDGPRVSAYRDHALAASPGPRREWMNIRSLFTAW